MPEFVRPRAGESTWVQIPGKPQGQSTGTSSKNTRAARVRRVRRPFTLIMPSGAPQEARVTKVESTRVVRWCRFMGRGPSQRGCQHGRRDEAHDLHVMGMSIRVRRQKRLASGLPIKWPIVFYFPRAGWP